MKFAWLAAVLPALLPTGAGPNASSATPGLFETRGKWELTATRDVAAQTVLVPLPLDYREQVPLTYSLKVTPPNALAKVHVRADKLDNQVVELELAPMKAEQTVEIAWTSWVLVAPRSFDDLPKRAAIPAEWPEEVRPWLASSRYVQAKDARIVETAADLRGKSEDVLEILHKTMERARTIYSKQSGRCTDLGAVEALDKQGSCTSCANLVAALLRASGVPARILAGCATWYGAQQTHYIVEAFVPEYGWYPLDSTLLQAPWEPHQQIEVAIVPVEYEDRGFGRMFAGAGVPYLSLTEYPGGVSGLSFRGTIEAGKNCDHIAEHREGFPPGAKEWNEVLARSRAAWRAWLAANAARDSVPKSLATKLDPKQLEDANNLKSLLRLLPR